jgi:8-oxo-dGTP diphosphatase
MNNYNVLRVTCAVIEKDGCILAAQRSETMSLPLKWEFPGGKVGEGETPKSCLVREIREEMGVDVEILRALPPSQYRYADKAIVLLPFVCRIAGGSIELLEHKVICWGLPEDLLDLDWAPADVPVLRSYILIRKDPASL